MNLSLIIATLNRHEALSMLLTNLAKQSILPHEIIVIEQGVSGLDMSSIPDEIRCITRIEYLSIKSSALARYEGLLKANGEVVAFFDDDITPPSNYFEVALQYLENNKECNGVGGGYRNIPFVEKNKAMTLVGRVFGIYGSGKCNRILVSGWGDYARGVHSEVCSTAEWLFGCNMVYRKSVLSNVNFPKEMMAWSFLEDLYLGNEITKKYGASMMILPDLTVSHKLSTSHGKSSMIVCRMRILHRYFIWKNLNVNRNAYTKFRFCLGLLANLLLDIGSYNFYLCISEHYKAWSMIYKSQNITLRDINNYVFKKA